MNATPTVLISPDWQSSGSERWQSCWERLHGDRRIEQRDWLTPKRANRVAVLGAEVGTAPGDVVLMARNLGCMLTVHWVATPVCAVRVRGALLVTPPQLDRTGMPPGLVDFRSIPQQHLPLPTVFVLSIDDPLSDATWGHGRAEAQGAESVSLGARGHVNAESGLGDWSGARVTVAEWMKDLI